MVVVSIIGISIAIAIYARFFSVKNITDEEGFHILGKWTHINYQEKCYLIDMKKDEVIGDSTFTISGTLYDKYKKMFKGHHETSVFNGHMEVSAYPITLTEGYNNHTGAILDDMISFSSYKVNEDGSFRRVYQVEVFGANPEIVVVYIYLENDEMLVAVCGQSEDEALEKYQQYLIHKSCS